jgi:hypothetical protein
MPRALWLIGIVMGLLQGALNASKDMGVLVGRNLGSGMWVVLCMTFILIIMQAPSYEEQEQAKKERKMKRFRATAFLLLMYALIWAASLGVRYLQLNS